MMPDRQPATIQDYLMGIILLLTVGLVGAIPFGILGLIFGSATAAGDVFFLVATILSAWLPLKLAIDAQVKGRTAFQMPRITPATLIVATFGFIVIVPVLYALTFSAILLSGLSYILLENVYAALLIGLGIQAMNIYRGAQREKAMGVNNMVFMRMQDMTAGGFDVALDPENITRQQPRADEPQVIYLPEDRLGDESAQRRNRYEDEDIVEGEIVINIDSERKKPDADE
ncbi:MAG: hypothetical protein AAFN11_07620 [Chloroflexota bacterium]